MQATRNLPHIPSSEQTLTIGGLLYTVHPFERSPAWKALLLSRPDGWSEMATVSPDGWTYCTCPEFGLGVGCAHLRALAAAGAFDTIEPAPVG